MFSSRGLPLHQAGGKHTKGIVVGVVAGKVVGMVVKGIGGEGGRMTPPPPPPFFPMARALAVVFEPPHMAFGLSPFASRLAPFNSLV